MKIFMKVASILVVAGFCCVSALGADTPGFNLKKIGDGVYAAIDEGKGAAGSNAGFIVGSNGVAVVDTFVDVAPARELLAEIRKITNLPVRYVINSHYHVDHVAGNSVFAEAGATILAHRNVRTWERTENMKFLGPTPSPADKAEVEAFGLPDLVYSEAVDIYLGSRLIQVRHLLGHTGSDSVVLVPDANVVFGGDLIWNARVPNLIDASTQPWIQTLDHLIKQHPSATFIPGHGDVANVQEVGDFRDYLSDLRRDISQSQAQGKAGDALVAAVLTDLKPKYGSWKYGFDASVKSNIKDTIPDLSGQKRLPVPVDDASLPAK